MFRMMTATPVDGIGPDLREVRGVVFRLDTPVQRDRSAFGKVEISDALATRQPEDQWLARADWQNHHYQARMRG